MDEKQTVATPTVDDKQAVDSPPILDKQAGSGVVIPPQHRRTHDPDVSFEEYYFYANQTRAEEDTLEPPKVGKNWLAYLVPNLQKQSGADPEGSSPVVNLNDQEKRMHITDEEWVNANRAGRNASAGAVFYLVTTDILGPFSLPYAFATTGWGPGVALFTVFGGMAGYSGYLLWDSFMGLDSYQFPTRAFGDIGYRLYGPWFRHLVNLLQAIQLICNVGAIVISNGQALSEASKFKLCYAICCLVWALAGFVFGQIRTLQKFTWLANLAVYINLLVIFITMGAAAHTPPLYSGSANSAGYSISPTLVSPVNGVYPKVQHSGGLPDPGNFGSAVNGLMQAVYSYGGAMVFIEFLSEMRRPRDFLKGMWGAQLFIYLCYMLYGLFMYGYQGQYVQNPSYLGISNYNLQTAGNSLAMVSALISATLYGNIGLKCIYNNVFVDLFKSPPLTQKSGKIFWVALIPVYWAIAFVIGSAIPDFSGFTSIVSATCILQFTYTFPPLMHIGYNIKKYAMQPGEGFDPVTGRVTRFDSGLKRIVRGYFSKYWYVNVFNTLFFLGALATAGLGIWAAVESLIAAYSIPELNAFGCTSPLDVSG